MKTLRGGLRIPIQYMNWDASWLKPKSPEQAALWATWDELEPEGINYSQLFGTSIPLTSWKQP